VNTLEAAVTDVAAFLEEGAVPYMVIGGFANLVWGRPRLTQDLDVTVSVAEERWPRFIEDLGRRFRILVDAPHAFARETRVIPLSTPTSVRVDMILAGLPYEEEALRRAVTVTLAGRGVRFCSAEDLIIHKLASDRPRDREDVEGILVRQRGALDCAYLDPRIEALATGLERPEILSFYRSRVT
jgi:hypothetical protein